MFNPSSLVSGAALPLLMLVAFSMISESRQDEVIKNSNEMVNVNNSEETIKIGNKKTTNYNIQESSYQPSQHTQVVFNVGKWKQKKSRASRPPTVDEMAIKQQILAVYETALEELKYGPRGGGGASDGSLVYLEHLGRILMALNPKYIATKRVFNVAFADPLNPDLEVIPPEAELPAREEELQNDDQNQAPMLRLTSGNQLTIQEQLDAVGERFGNSVEWDKEFVRDLFLMSDGEFSPSQLAFKRLFQCLSQPAFCKQKIVTKVKASEAESSDEAIDRMTEQATMEAASELDEASVLDQPEFLPPREQPVPYNQFVAQQVPFNERPYREPYTMAARPRGPPPPPARNMADQELPPMRGYDQMEFAPREHQGRQQAQFHQNYPPRRPVQQQQQPNYVNHNGPQQFVDRNPPTYGRPMNPQRIVHPPRMANSEGPLDPELIYKYGPPRSDDRRGMNKFMGARRI